ncbi:MAG: AmmeMemoRadiSam system protein B [Terasakiella sp.]|uniref:AmmeMemoRadiSam system protein B n=1 Tax=unclassified Terasakiella TaxID=2614952 RepID=UPI003B008C44
METVRAAAVAGTFYPDDPIILRKTIEDFLTTAQAIQENNGTYPEPPKALIVPHAGYVYSGPVAASAYYRLLAQRHTITRVVLLGPCHRVPVGGLALSSATYFETPFGRVKLDQDLREKVEKMPQIFTFDPTHQDEHSLEVHLPFLQAILADFTLLPLVVGQASPTEVADVLDAVWGGPETLIIISTDLSHYLDYNACQSLDNRTVQAIEKFDISHINNNQACGRIPLKGLLEIAKIRHMDIITLDVRNSGDTAGSKDRVVGYGAWMLSGGHQINDYDAFSFRTKAVLNRHGTTLLQLAAASIKRGLSHHEPVKLDLQSFPTSLKEPGASFVTLEKDGGNLRGCIGSLQAHAPLAKDIADNAYKAAFQDPRFHPLNADELNDLSLHISILSPAFPMEIKDEADLLEQLRPNIDGLIIQDGTRRALFLPSVWEKLPDKKQFLTHLKRKAGLSDNHWSDNFTASRFVTESIHSESLDVPENLWQDNIK